MDEGMIVELCLRETGLNAVCDKRGKPRRTAWYPQGRHGRFGMKVEDKRWTRSGRLEIVERKKGLECSSVRV